MTGLLSEKRFVFWPVGSGDCTSVVVNDEIVLQVDIRHLECANDKGDPHTPIVDILTHGLPKRGGEPYLAAFALSHPDTDHVQGFAELLERVQIGELWFTPRVFREYKKDLGEDALAFKNEAMRRTALTIEHNGRVASGDRVRLIGFDRLLYGPVSGGFPLEYLTTPGSWITQIDRVDTSDDFAAFIHAPFEDDSAGERNETSLAMQANLISGNSVSKALLFGDLSYSTIRRIFDVSKKAGNERTLEWNVLLAPHHCSKSAMYHRDEGDEKEKLKQDILDDLEAAQLSCGYVVASSDPIPANNRPGDNPPHAKAKARYEEIVHSDFICTQEHGSKDSPIPVVLDHTDHGLDYTDPDAGDDYGSKLASAVAAARGSDHPPQEKVGFGRK